MLKLLARLVLASSLFMLGCAQPEEPFADSIPEIPPGRASADYSPGDEGAATTTSPLPPLPK